MVKVLRQKQSFTADGKRNFEVVEYQNLNEALDATGLRVSEIEVVDGFLCYGKYKLMVVLPVEDSLEDVLMLRGRYNVVAITKRAETILATLFPHMPHKGNSYLFKSLPEVVKQLHEIGEVRVRHTEPKQLV